MTRYRIEYCESVYYDCVIDADSETDAWHRFNNGDITNRTETGYSDRQLLRIEQEGAHHDDD